MRPWCLWLCAAASLCAAAFWPAKAWSADLELALGNARPVVVLVADPERPLAAATRRAVEDAWIELRPSAERVLLERAPPRLACATSLALCVFASDGELEARRDGALDSATARQWLSTALSAAEQRGDEHELEPRALFERARRALELGAVERAQRMFTFLAEPLDSDLGIAARERLARIAVDRGEVARARELLETTPSAPAGSASAARRLFTRGSVELAERQNRAAIETLRVAARALDATCPSEAAEARLECARALSATGEISAAIALLEELARSGPSHALRDGARQLAAELRSPSLTH